MPSSARGPGEPGPRRRWQFGLGALLLFTTLFALLVGAFAGMIRAETGEHFARSRSFLLLAIAAPLGILVLVSGCRAMALWWGKRKKDPP